MAAFARKHGVNAQRLSWWRKRLGDGEHATAAFVPAVVGGAAAPVTMCLAAPVLMRLPRGIEIEVTDVGAVSPAWLAAVVAALERQG